MQRNWLTCDSRIEVLRMLCRRIAGPAALVIALMLAGCHGDPNVAKRKYVESGERYFQQGKYREAGIQFSNAIKIDHNYVEAHFKLAQACLQLNMYGQASAELERTIELQPDNAAARLQYANLLIAGGKADEAQAQADAMKATQSENAQYYALLSAIALRRNHKDDALKEIRRALELAPNEALLHENLALLESEDPSKLPAIEEELKKAVSLQPRGADPRVLLSQFYMKNLRWAEAQKAASDAVAVEPNSLRARGVLAEVYLKQGNIAAAEQTYRTASQQLANDPAGARLYADFLTENGKLEQAKTEFAALASRFPADLSIKEGYARILLLADDVKGAEPVLASLVKSNGKNPRIESLQAVVLLKHGDADQASTILQHAVKDYPEDAFLWFWLGKAAVARGDLFTAEKSFLQVEQLDPNFLLNTEELAQIAGARNDLALLEMLANRTVANAPYSADGYFWRAVVSTNRATYDTADGDLKTALQLNPQKCGAYLQVSKIRFAQKRYTEVLPQLQQALSCDPDSVEGVRLLMAYYLYQKQPQEAVAQLQAHIAARPKNSGFLNLLATYQVQNNQWREASDTSRHAVEMNSSDWESVGLFTQIEVKLGETGTAIEAWKRWLSSHPKDAGAAALLGALEESQNSIEQAKSYYHQALQIQPNQPMAANNLAFIMLEHGENVDVALSLAQIARQSLPNSPVTADTLAWAYYHKGTYEFARDLLENACKLSPDDAALQYHLGEVYDKLRSRSTAEAHLRRAIALDPSSDAAQKAKSALQGLS